jgi:pimeloyl-ACP methyl ester carboxylesterase
MIRTQFHNMKDSYDDVNFTPPYLSTIKAQTMIVCGDRDVYFDVDTPALLYESIPDSYLWIIPNAGHNLDLWDRIITTNNLADFLTGKWKT